MIEIALGSKLTVVRGAARCMAFGMAWTVDSGSWVRIRVSV